MAEHMYRKGVKVDPRSYRAHINLIVYLSEHGKYTQWQTHIFVQDLKFDNKTCFWFCFHA